MKTQIVIGLTNSVPEALSDTVRRWLKVPFGQHPHPSGCVQELSAGSSGKIVAAIRTALANGRAPLPVYNGHPDDGESVPLDAQRYGSVVDAEVQGDCLAFLCDLTQDGLDLVHRGRNLFSPHWMARLAKNLATPFELLSIGLTDRPVMPVAAIANQRPATDGQKGAPVKNREQLISLYGLEATATDEQIFAAAQAGVTRVTTLTNELATEKASVTNLTGKVDGLTAELQTEKASVASGVTALANERKAHIALLVDNGLSTGRIAPAARGKWEADFGQDFDGAVVRLANAKPELKVEAKTRDLAKRTIADGVDGIVSLVNEEVTKTGCSFDAAYMRIKKTHKELFAPKAAS